MSPIRYMLDYVAWQGWKVGDAVVAYPFPEAVIPPRRNDDQAPTEVVYFGRLEIRKGLDLFLDAVSDLPANVDITFLGRDTLLPSGEIATAHIGRRLQNRSFKIRSDLMRDQAVKYLAAGNRLAVISSLSETFGFTVAECAVNGLPFIAARAGGTSEVIPPRKVHEGLFFEPKPKDLSMARHPDLSVLTCFLKAFNHHEGIDALIAEFVYMPTGGPLVLSFRTRQTTPIPPRPSSRPFS